MRVAFVSLETSHLDDTADSRRFERVARAVAKAGHEVMLFCGQWWDDYREEFTADGLHYKGVSLGTAQASFLARLPALLARYRPDIVHVRPSSSGQVLAALAGSKLLRAPLVVQWAGDEAAALERRGEQSAVSRADIVLVPSELVQTRVRKLVGDSVQTAIVPRSIDFDRLRTVTPNPTVDIVYAHPLDETANFTDFVLGLAELRERDWSATVLGDGPRRAELEQTVEEFRLMDRVTFVGECPRDERLAYYRGGHVFVQTAVRERFATELLWALACGCVGIVEFQAESSAHELVANVDRSFRVTNPVQLADAIRDAGEFDQRTVDETWRAYDHRQVADQYVAAYERALTTEQYR